LKNKLISFQNDYKCLLEKFETFANLNCELSTKIELLESSAPSSGTDEGLIKKNEKLKVKLASSLEATKNLLEKMEILSIHNDELTTKLENIGSTPEVSLVAIPEIIKKDASTSCFDLIDNSNLYNQVLVKNVVIETCSDEIAMENLYYFLRLQCRRPWCTILPLSAPIPIRPIAPSSPSAQIPSAKLPLTRRHQWPPSMPPSMATFHRPRRHPPPLLRDPRPPHHDRS
jgi:hypothetical protein